MIGAWVRMRLVVFSIAAALVAACPFPSPAGESALPNGDLAEWEDGTPAAWGNWRADAMSRTVGPDGRQAVRMVNDNLKDAIYLEGQAPLRAEWHLVVVSALMRVKNLQLGEAGWHEPRVALRFRNDAGEQVGGYPDMPRLRENSEWVRREVVLQKPDGATHLQLQPGLWLAAGTLEIADIRVEGFRSASDRARAQYPGLPPGFPPGRFAEATPDGGPAGWELTEPEAFSVNPESRVLRVHTEKGDSWARALYTCAVEDDWTRLALSFRLLPDAFLPGPETAPARPARWRQAGVHVSFLDDGGKELGGGFGAYAGPDTNEIKRNPGWREMTATGGVPAHAVLMRVELGLFNATGEALFSELRLEPSNVVVMTDAPWPEGKGDRWEETRPTPLTETRAQLSLNGLWRFVPAEGPTEREPAGWGYIRVPGDWQEADALAARGDSREWLVFEGANVNRAWYEREVVIPETWQDSAVELRFDRLSTDAQVRVNGEDAGTVTWPGATLELSRLLRPGQANRIRLRVVAVRDRDQVPVYMGYAQNEMEPARLAHKGLIGDVYLLKRPKGLHVTDWHIRPSTRDWRLNVDLELSDVTRTGPVDVAAEAIAPDGTVAKRFPAVTVGLQTDPESGLNGTASWPWPDPALWDVEQPNTYVLRVAVTRGGETDVFEQRFGFREFRIEGRRFFLNNTEIRLRPGNLAYGAMPTQLLARGLNYGNNWPSDLTERGSDTDYDDRLIDEADRVGLLLSAKAPHMGTYANDLKSWQDPATKADYRRHVAALVRRWRNHPSVVMWGHSANVFQNQVDGTPWLLGKRDFSNVQEYCDRMRNVSEAIAMIKSVDPEKPVYAHFGTYAGEVYTSNLYLNFLPLQEREEWLSEWARNGEMPFMAVEFGLPLYASLMRGRAGYAHQGHSEPFLSEWAAVYAGSTVYEWEPEDYRETVRSRYDGSDPQREYVHHHRHEGFTERMADTEAYRSILDLFITNTYRSWRTLGVSGGMVPWHHDLHPALQRVNGPTLAWIADAGPAPSPDGPEQVFTGKTHHFRAGTTVEKQLVLINDLRAPAPFTLTWSATVAGTVCGEGRHEGDLAVAETRFMPVSIALPGRLPGNRAEGAIRLQATIGGHKHEDTFPFSVFADPAPGTGLRVSVFDPEGETTRWLEGLGCRVEPWDRGQPTATVAVIGRHALDPGNAPPGDIADFVREGGRLLVMAQDPMWLQRALHLRTAPHVARRVYAVNPEHPVVSAADDADLRDWNGSGTLLEAYPRHPGYEWTPTYGWHWGNRHAVCSAPIEKPHRTSWRPLLECEFDLAYTPLMEMAYGKGRVTLCTLDVEGRTQPDPAAERLSRRLLRHVSEDEFAAKPSTCAYVGGAAGSATLRFLGVDFSPTERLPETGLVVVGPTARVSLDELRKAAVKGARIVVLRRTPGSAVPGLPLVERPDFIGSTRVPRWPEAAGLSASDLRWRNAAHAVLLAGSDDVEIAAGGQLGRMAAGKGVVLFAQAGPDSVPADEKSYLRFTRWRQTRALSQVLANLGATFEQDHRFLALLQAPDHAIHLTGVWQAAHTLPLPESPWREWHAYRDPTPDALARIAADAPAEGWQSVPVPAYLESYGPGWRFTDGETVFRREIDWPTHAAGKPLFLSLGRVDEHEMTFFNGTEIGHSRQWLHPRGHRVPAELVKPGRNVIAIRHWDEGIHGGMCGSPGQVYLCVAGDDPGFYHPDYRDDDVSRGQTEADWQAWAEQWQIADNPYRYYRW